jgi:hypothetical protein
MQVTCLPGVGPQAPQGDIGESYNGHLRRFRLAQSCKSCEKCRETMSRYGQAKTKKIQVLQQLMIKISTVLGRSQVVRQRILIPAGPKEIPRK